MKNCPTQPNATTVSQHSTKIEVPRIAADFSLPQSLAVCSPAGTRVHHAYLRERAREWERRSTVARWDSGARARRQQRRWREIGDSPREQKDRDLRARSVTAFLRLSRSSRRLADDGWLMQSAARSLGATGTRVRVFRGSESSFFLFSLLYRALSRAYYIRDEAGAGTAAEACITLLCRERVWDVINRRASGLIDKSEARVLARPLANEFWFSIARRWLRTLRTGNSRGVLFSAARLCCLIMLLMKFIISWSGL